MNIDAWVRKEIKAMNKMDVKIDRQLDKLEAMVGIKTKRRKPRNTEEALECLAKAKAIADRLGGKA